MKQSNRSLSQALLMWEAHSTDEDKFSKYRGQHCTFPPIMTVRGTKSMFGFALSPVDQTCIFLFLLLMIIFYSVITLNHRVKILQKCIYCNFTANVCLRLYNTMTWRQFISCLLYSWILFTWTSNIEFTLTLMSYSFLMKSASLILFSWIQWKIASLRVQTEYTLNCSFIFFLILSVDCQHIYM